MSLRQETASFAGLSFTTTTLPALRGLALYAKLGEADSSVPFLSMLDRADSNMFALSVSYIPPDSAQALLRDIFAATTVIAGGRVESLGGDDAINRVFTGKVLTMLQVAWWVIGVNFADFFEAGSDSRSASDESAPEPAVKTENEAKPSDSIPTRRRVRSRGGSSTPAE